MSLPLNTVMEMQPNMNNVYDRRSMCMTPEESILLHGDLSVEIPVCATFIKFLRDLTD
jgi:hypothetical protein